MALHGADHQKPVVIVGMGPGGLSAAITAARAGHNVIIVENRDHFSRVQRISADAATLEFLNSLRDPDPSKESEEDRKFFEHQIFKTGSEGTVQVKDLQAFLARKLQEKFKDNVEIRRGVGHKVVGMDPDKQTVTLESPGGKQDTVEFSHMIAADGARRGVTDILNKSTDKAAYQVHYQAKDLQPRQAEVGTVSLTAVPGAKLPEAPNEEFKFNPSHMKRLLELGWDKPYFPRVYIFRNEENTKFFVSGEVPSIISNVRHEDDRAAQTQMMEAWGKFMVSVRLGYPESDVALIKSANPANDKRKDEKNALKSTVFSLEMRAADTSAVKLGQQGAFVLVGDAYKNANFFFKHGMNDAIKDGILAAKCIDGPDGKYDFDAYAKQHATQEKMLATRMGFADSQNEMPEITTNLEQQVSALIKIAKTFNNQDIKDAIAHIKNMPGPTTEHFDAYLYQIQVEALSKKVEQVVNDKISALREKSKGSMIHSKDEVSLVKMQTELSSVNKNLQKAFFKYYDTNIEKRKEFYQSIQSDKTKKSKIS